MSTLAICTAWQNHRELEADYFAAIEVGGPDQLVIVDDRSDIPLPYAAMRIEPGEQGGFSTANNHALGMVECDHVLFLNNDVRPLRPDWLDDIRAAIESGVMVGPLVMANPLSEVDGKLYPYIDGWCVAMTVEDAYTLGGWDTAYDAAGPGYYSDNALSFKANTFGEGMTLRELRPGLEHKGGQTGGTGPKFHYALMMNGPIFQQQVRAVVGK